MRLVGKVMRCAWRDHASRRSPGRGSELGLEEGDDGGQEVVALLHVDEVSGTGDLDKIGVGEHLLDTSDVGITGPR